MQTASLKRVDRLASVYHGIPALSRELAVRGYCVIRDVFHPEEIAALADAWEDASANVRRREVTVTYAGVTSTRQLDTLSAKCVDDVTPEVESLYYDEVFVRFLSLLAGEEVVPLDDELEKYVINALSIEGDHHGEHLDSFPFACTIPLEQPQPDQGGCLQITNNGGRFVDVELEPGCLAFFRSADFVHRVTSIGPSCRRMVLSMAYATPATSGIVSNTRELMYGEQ
jgi:predicted 2-oxoglutarate/Fe(II)-dependent dioxygenase YbiX